MNLPWSSLLCSNTTSPGEKLMFHLRSACYVCLSPCCRVLMCFQVLVFPRVDSITCPRLMAAASCWLQDTVYRDIINWVRTPLCWAANGYNFEMPTSTTNNKEGLQLHWKLQSITRSSSAGLQVDPFWNERVLKLQVKVSGIMRPNF